MVIVNNFYRIEFVFLELNIQLWHYFHICMNILFLFLVEPISHSLKAGDFSSVPTY